MVGSAFDLEVLLGGVGGKVAPERGVSAVGVCGDVWLILGVWDGDWMDLGCL